MLIGKPKWQENKKLNGWQNSYWPAIAASPFLDLMVQRGHAKLQQRRPGIQTAAGLLV